MTAEPESGGQARPVRDLALQALEVFDQLGPGQSLAKEQSRGMQQESQDAELMVQPPRPAAQLGAAAGGLPA